MTVSAKNATTEAMVLALIAAHDGEWGWYQLDRALTSSGVVGVHVVKVVTELATAGLVEIDGAPQLAASRYRITPTGRRMCDTGDAPP